MTGRSAWLAFGVAVIVGFLTVLPYLLLSGAIAFKGGDFTIVQLGLGKMASGLFSKMPLAVYYLILAICTAVQLWLVITACMSLAAWQIWVSIGLLVLMTVIALIWFAKKGKEVQTEIDYDSMS